MGLLVLLPPSESKSEMLGSGASFNAACPEYANDVARVLKHLGRLPKRGRAAFYGVSTREKAETAHGLNLAALEAPGTPAIERYTGVVYGHLDYLSLSDPSHARKHIMIVSGMFGLIPAGIPIPNYKLPMGTWLLKHWKKINGARLAALAEGHNVISLLPAAHAKTLGNARVAAIDFKLAGGKKSAGHFGKAIKGRFVRFLMETKAEDLNGAANFRADGYQFDGQNFVQR